MEHLGTTDVAYRFLNLKSPLNLVFLVCSCSRFFDTFSNHSLGQCYHLTGKNCLPDYIVKILLKFCHNNPLLFSIHSNGNPIISLWLNFVLRDVFHDVGKLSRDAGSLCSKMQETPWPQIILKVSLPFAWITRPATNTSFFVNLPNRNDLNWFLIQSMNKLIKCLKNTLY